MNYFVRLTAGWLLYYCVPFFLLILIVRFRYYKPVSWRYPLYSLLVKHRLTGSIWCVKLVLIFKYILLCGLLFFIGKPQLVDESSLLPVQGIDIVLVVDASGSMQFIDDQNDGRSRFNVAKDEAIRFVQKRDNDAIGFVIFGNDAVTRSPITFDKRSLKKVIQDVELGFIDPDGTVLATGMMTALNRLKYSRAKSKIMIVLTDGEPSENDMNIALPIEIAQQLGVKIYTVGIGSEELRRLMHPMFGWVIVPTVNKELLERIARETGGQFFQAQNPKDMRMIYDTIDTLEKNEHAIPLFTRYYEFFALYDSVLLGIALLIVFLSLLVCGGL